MKCKKVKGGRVGCLSDVSGSVKMSQEVNDSEIGDGPE